ncbi:unnamed protein product [Medioppia subpectinata]|uniref:carnitine O-palmitoyltransferase n=1 Tax=Medioppia subpectinata TaxID=1979941 RepID=A0A7R9KI60_9ACAR|nr:unnamed protein product [Medioppia subpectinata]CAG2103753.1 unnamed protein product [Medioppia subpectinata]
MAEAHSAVAFSFQVTHEGMSSTAVWLSGLRSWRNRFSRFGNNFASGIYPSSVEFLITIVAVVLSAHLLLHRDLSCGLVSLVDAALQSWLSSEVSSVVSCVAFAVVLWLFKMLFMRYSLKLLLMYKQWMYESRANNKPSTTTKLWLLLIRALTLTKSPQLYSYQASLPRLPLPPLHTTIDRYLLSVRALLDDREFERTRRLAEEFRDGVGRKFQRYLWLKSWWSSNYVSDWWEEFVYLRGRQPLMVNSNFYGIDALMDGPTNSQTARAANLVYAALLFRKQIARQELKPILVQNLVPLCSAQYERMFNTTRVPGRDADRIQHLDDSPHIVVLHAGKFYKLTIHHRGRLLLPKQLQQLLRQIVADQSPAAAGESKLASLTAAERGVWAETRAQFFAKGINRVSLAAVEKAAFVLVLDSEDFEFATADQLDTYGQLLLHGKGNDRWFDKSFNLIVARNARVGFNGEHSWADAPVMAHLWEFVLHYDFHVLQYDADGDCRLGNGFDASPPIRLQWEFPDALCHVIDQSYENAQCVLKDVDLRLFRHDAYGKGFIKTCRVSPDAYIQMALQLAYLRDVGHLSLTYEASMTRLFREGRTETVRPVTVQSAAFVRAVAAGQPPDTCRELLRVACARHQRAYQEAMCGKGVDRHLFCLYVISQYLEVDSPFLKQVLSEPWKLSTSQTPHGQVGLLSKCISAGGGFGPVADDGYGVSYIVAGEETIFFHISSKSSSRTTDSRRFADNVDRALRDLRALFL